MVPPVVERELRVALLRRKARSQWLMAVWTAGGLCFLFLLVLDLGSSRTTGSSLFRWLFAMACGSVVWRGFGLTADLFSEERRSGTLGLLVLTGMRPLEIFVNKLTGAALMAAYGLLGALPFFAIPFLAGGVSFDQFFCALIFLGNGLLFCVAIGVLASVLNREGGQAQAAAIGITVLLCVIAPVIYEIRKALPHASAPNPEWLTPSPAVAPILIFGQFTGNSPHLFWMSSGFTLVYSLTALLLAAAILQRTWRDGPELTETKGWRSRFQKWARGSEQWQLRLRARLLTDRPFWWLAVRDRRPIVFATILLSGFFVLWLGGWLVWGAGWLQPATAVTSSTLMHLGMSWIIGYAASRHLAEDRLSGGFEILLTAPVNPHTIIEGQSRALLIQFRTVLFFMIVVDAILCVTSVPPLTESVLGPVGYLAAWSAMIFYWLATHLEMAALAMWISTWTGRAGYAAIQAMRVPATYIFWIWLLCGGLLGIAGGGHVDLILVAVVLVIAAFGALGRRRTLREKLIRELKWIAAAAIPARNDKRFKSWNPEAIYPPGRWGDFNLREGNTRTSTTGLRVTPVRPRR